MKIADTLKFILTVLLMGATIALAAFDPVNDDTDIFLASPANPAERPNVLIVMDNTANWNNAFANEKSALVQVINGLTEQFNLGLMLFPETGGGNDSVDGGYVRSHVRPMDQTNRTALASLINNLDKLNDKGNNGTIGLALHEAYLYYAGKTSIASHGKVKTDKDGTTDPLLSPLTGHALPAGTSPALYRSPLADGCERSFIIYISNGPANENASARADLEAKLGSLTGVSPPAVIGITPSGMQSNWADEMAKFMANADVLATSGSIANSAGVQNVYTYVIEVDATTSGQGPDMTALLKSVAANGKGKYFGVASSALGTSIVDALNSILIDVQAVNSVFASTTLPVSVNVRGTNLNQVYIGVFRPDSNKSPRWLGNLKMYNLALNTATGTVFLADAANGAPPAIGNAAENTSTGFVSQNSPSFWTTDSTYWGFRDPIQNGPGGISDKPDGDLVEKGGAAQQLRIAFANATETPPRRNLYTCTDGGSFTSQCPDAGTPLATPLANTPFTTDNTDINAASLQLDTRLISPLTAYATQPVASVTDRLPVILNNTWSGSDSRYVTNLNNFANSQTVDNLTTATPKTVTSLTGQVPNTQVVPLSSVAKASGKYRFQAAAALPSIYVAGASVSISGTSNSLFHATWTIDTVDTTNNRFVILGGPSGNQTATGGNATVTSGTTTSTTAQATLPSHGFVSGQAVTITDASPVWFNGTYNITVTDADNFRYTMTTAAGNATGTISATGITTTATATTAAVHGFPVSTVVNIVGASDPAYNGAKTIIDCLPAASCVGAMTFRYSVGATAIGPNTNASGVTASQGGGTTVTVTTMFAHGYAHNDLIFISGSDFAGYNGGFNISCPPFVAGSPCTTLTSFDITTASVLPANTSNLVFAARGTSKLMLGSAPNHGFAAGDSIVIEGPAPHAGTYLVTDIFGTDLYFVVDTTSALAAVTQSTFTVRHQTNHKAWVTLSNHGYTHGQQLRIAGATPTGYNGEPLTIRVCQPDPGPPAFSCYNQANVFSYPLTTLQGTNTSTAVTASVKTTTARATSVNHGFVNGSTVSVAGSTPTVFNGSYAITVVDANNFTYTIASAQGDATGTTTAVQTGGSSAERDLIIRWVRGQDNFQDENSNASTTDIRASVHGDVLHSRPAVINYNRFTGSDDDVFVFYGGNDGVLHAVKGGYAVPTGDASGLTPGREAWGFVPQEFFGQFKRMRNNSPSISSAFKKPYFMDGPMGIHTLDSNDNGKLGDTGDQVNLYVANRRGGRFVYALDVNTPTDPKFLWKISDATTGFSELGQTWSQPTVITGLAGLSVPVLVFGAGYDPAADDLDPAVITAVNTTTGAITTTSVGTVNRTMGRGLYVVNALTGALIWSAGGTGSGATEEVSGMIYAIPSDVTVIENQSGGPTNRAYVGDTGGNVWRIDFGSPDGTTLPNCSTSPPPATPQPPDCTRVTKLASLADQSTAAGRRKFLFPPDVVDQGTFDAVLIGSGDREHPFDTTVTNRFYMLKDTGPDSGPVTGASEPAITEQAITGPPAFPGLSDLTSNCIQDAAACAVAGEDQAIVTAKLGTDRGWFITLFSGEKVVGNAVSISGTTFFNTNQPSSTAGGGTCGSNLGIARQYQLATADATATSDLNAVGGLTGADRSLIHAGGGYLPSPVHVVVMLDGKPVEAVISGVQVSTPAGATLSARLRKFWYKEMDPQ